MVSFITKPITMYDKPTTKLFNHACIVPFKHIEIHSWGQVSACCHTWLPQWVGNLLTETAEEVFNNGIRKQIQDDMRQGKFTYCNDQCPQLNALLNNNGKEQYWDIIPIADLDKTIANDSIVVYFSYDLSCNLQCPSCRKDLIVWRTDDPNDENGQRLLKVHNKTKELVDILLSKHRKVTLSITGSGDAFASPLYWDYLVELSRQKKIPKNLFLFLQTNGVMMTKKKWEEIKPLWSHINYINVSVDAARESTYNIVRKNGNFKRLNKNLDDLDKMILENRFPNLHGWQTNFIVQRDNFRELKEFVEWQLRYKSKPKIWTNLIAKWWHMTEDEFDDMAIWKDGHQHQNELLEILKDPIFINPQIKLGNLSSFVRNLKT